MNSSKMKCFSILIILLSFACKAKSQTDSIDTAHNALYLEAGGPGSVGSLNYERILPLKPNFNLGLRIGISTYNLKDFTDKFNPDFISPISINGLYGGQHKVEFGLGTAVTSIVQANPSNFQPDRNLHLHANVTIGYRYQKEEGGLLFRISYTPIIEFYKNFRHWAGASVGYVF